MNRTGKMFIAGCMALAMMVPQAVYGATAAEVQISAREGIPVVGVSQSSYENVAISRVSNYVNVRTEPNTTSSIVGKIYNNCAATILSTVNGEDGSWYQIQSGTVQGYIKAEYFITGAEAEKIAKDVGTVYVTINTETLRLREEPNTTSKTLTLLSKDAEYIELREVDDFVEIQVDADLSGYVHKDYIVQRVEFKTAVSVEEEQQQLAEAERLKKEADEAIARVEGLKSQLAAGSVSAPQTGTEQGNTAAENGLTGTTPMESIGLIAANPTEDPQEAARGQGTAVSDAGQAPAADVSVSGTAGAGAGDGGVSNAGPGSTGTENNQGQAAGQTAPGSEYGPGMESGSGTSQTAGETSGPGAPGSTQAQAGELTSISNAELTSATRTAIVAYAKQFLGNPYVYGGTSLTDGADCSGFVMSIFAHFGIETGRSSRDQAQNGKEIAVSEVQPGDLLFYASGDYINHVALYIGGGQVIHASTEKTGIVISTAYYRTPYKAVTFLN